MQGHMVKHQGLSEDAARGKRGQEPLLWSLWEAQEKEGKQP